MLRHNKISIVTIPKCELEATCPFSFLNESVVYEFKINISDALKMTKIS